MRLRFCPPEYIEIGIEGYGTFDTDDGYGQIIYIEKDPSDGQMYLYVWGDINSQEPTHKICLKDAAEHRRA